MNILLKGDLIALTGIESVEQQLGKNSIAHKTKKAQRFSKLKTTQLQDAPISQYGFK